MEYNALNSLGNTVITGVRKTSYSPLHPGEASRYPSGVNQQHLPGDESADPAGGILLALEKGPRRSEIFAVKAYRRRRRILVGLDIKPAPAGLSIGHQGAGDFMSRL